MKICILESCTTDESIKICCAECDKKSGCDYLCDNHLKDCEYRAKDMRDK